MVYVCSMGGAVSEVVVIVAVSVFVVIVFLVPWSSASNMQVLSFGRDTAAFIVLVVLPFTTSIHAPSYCSLSFPCIPHRHLSLSSFVSSFTAVFLGLRSSSLDELLLLRSLLLLLLLLLLPVHFLSRWCFSTTLKLFSCELSDPSSLDESA